jgi:anti-sigma regulatory factor (Ser/Thr protein kinase)
VGFITGGPMEPGLSVNHRALPGAVPSIRAAVSRFLDACDVAPATVADVGLAVTEACANVVRHAYPDGPGDLRCRVALRGDEVVVVVSDWGCGVGAASFQPGLGLGLGLMDRVADAMLISRSDGETAVTLHFTRRVAT